MWRTSAAVLLCLLLATPARAQSPRIEVTKLSIEGVNAVKTGELKRALATGASSWLPWGKQRYFNRTQFEADLKRVRVFYADRGYPDAQVVSFDLDLNEKQDAIAITLVIHEGPPVIVQEIHYSGFEALPEAHFDRMKRDAPLKAGLPRDRAALQMTRERALDELRDHGYPDASVRAREAQAGDARKVAVTFEATPATLARFGEIEVAGNTSVSDEVVRRHLTFQPGRMFRLGQMQESQRRLYGLELFEFVNVDAVEPEEGAAAREQVPVRVTVTEGKHRKLNVGVGYGSEEKARTEANWRHVNFFGGARTAGIEARWSSLDRGVRLNFQQPYLFSPRVTLSASAEAWYTREPAFSLDTSGGRITVQRRFSMGGPRSTSPSVTTLSGSVVYNRESYTIANELLEDLTRRDEIIALKLDPRTGAGRGTVSALDVDYTRNTTENVLDARRGYIATAHYEEAGTWMGGDYAYREVTLEGRHYFAAFDRFVWANRLKVGSIAGPGDVQNLAPFFKRYFLGGSSSLRGWGRFQVGPLSGSGLPLGGHSMLEASSEFRIPVWGHLSLVLFGEAGNVWSDPWEIDPGDLRFDVGSGLRYHTPIGPIRFDVGYQINPIEGLLVKGKQQPRRFRLHFSVGQAF